MCSRDKQCDGPRLSNPGVKAIFFPDSSLNPLNGLGAEKCPLGRKVGFGPQKGSETYRHVVGKGTLDCTKLGRKKQHD